DVLLADARYERISEVTRSSLHHHGRLGATRTEQIDSILLDRRWGIPIFLGVMYTMFLLTISLGSAFIDLFDQLGALMFVEIPAAMMHAVGLPEGLVVAIAN